LGARSSFFAWKNLRSCKNSACARRSGKLVCAVPFVGCKTILTEMKPGEIYLADFPQVGQHPVIILSREDLNRGGQAVVVLCTSAHFALRRTLPNTVPFQAG